MGRPFDYGKFKRIIPYLLILVFTGATRFYNMMYGLNIPGHSYSIGNNGVDEGIFLMTGKLVSNGYRMYIDVNTQQGPLFSYIFTIIGGDLLHARLITASMAVIGVIGMMIMSEKFGNLRIGVIASIFLTVNFLFFKESRYASFDLYSTVFMIFGFLAIMIYFRTLDGNSFKANRKGEYAIPLIFSGVLFSLAAMSKLFAVIPLFSLGLYMLAGTVRVRSRPEEFRSRIGHIAILVVSTLIPTILMMSLFGFQETLRGMLLDNMYRPGMSLTEKVLPLMLFAFYTCIPLLFSFITVKERIRDRSVQLMLIWFLPLLIFIILQSPVWEHYFLMVIAPLCYLGARGFDTVFKARRPLFGFSRITSGSGIPARSRGKSISNLSWMAKQKGPAISVLLALVVVYIISSVGANTAMIMASETTPEKKVADDIDDITSEEEFIISGDPIIGVYADRLQPPEATNLAKVRYPALTDLDLINITCDYNVTLVVFTYHLSTYETYLEFVDTYYEFYGAYTRSGDFSETKGEIDVGSETFSVYSIEDDLNLTAARSEFIEEMI